MKISRLRACRLPVGVAPNGVLTQERERSEPEGYLQAVSGPHLNSGRNARMQRLRPYPTGCRQALPEPGCSGSPAQRREGTVAGACGRPLPPPVRSGGR
jgi:hypothetical protein